MVCSFADPMPNSSQFWWPSIIAPASRSFVTAVALICDMKVSRILLLACMGWSL